MSELSINSRGNDRRQNNTPVANDRRSGFDRRKENENASAVKAFEAIPMVRRTVSIPDEFKQGQLVPALQDMFSG